ncbi:MAG: hypothetical protein HY853_02875, partial [Burkholderiales bacterium]|nr:hypothetical protein [Burkholderiales bacterium]
MTMRWPALRLPVAALLCAGAFFISAQHLKTAPRQRVDIEMQVALPLFVQVAMAA